MSKRFVFFYFMKDLPERIKEVVPDHIRYWQQIDVADYSGGPFADHSGGLISFSASSMEMAQNKAMSDPFVTEGVLETYWLKEWMGK